MKISQHMITPGAPVSMERVLSDRQAQVRRETRDDGAQMVPCPGGCGGLARLESPMTIIRGGQVRTCRMAECLHECKVETVRGRHGKPRMVAERFELPVALEVLESTPPPAAPQPAIPVPGQPRHTGEGPEAPGQNSSELTGANGLYGNGSHKDVPDSSLGVDPRDEGRELSDANLQSLMASAMKKAHLTQVEVGKLLGCSQSSISKMLRGLPVAEGTAEAALAWVESVHDASETAGGAGPSESPSDEKREAAVTSHSHPEPPQSRDSDPPGGENPKASKNGAVDLASQARSEKPKGKDVLPVPAPEGAVSEPGAGASGPSPYESILRTLLEEVAQRRLEELAGSAAAGVKVRVTLEWQTE